MLNQEQLYQLLEDFQQISDESLEIDRKEYLHFLKKNVDAKPIKILSGFRRSGKSYLLKQLIRYLKNEKNIRDENIFCINFEHDILFNNRKIEDLRKLFEIFRTYIWKKGKIYIFLDEIQLVKGFETFVRTLYEQGQSAFDIYITGSNSSLLSSEFSSALAGRSIEMTVDPFSFEEFLLYHKVKIKDEKSFYKNKLLVKQLFQDYFYNGGIVESFSLQKEFKKNYFESLFRKVLLDDIIKRFKIENACAIENLYRFVISDIGSILSPKNIQASLTKNGYSISIPTIYSYIDHLITSFGLFELRKFDWKLHGIFDKSTKYFLIDNGILSALSLNKREIEEKLLENLVFLNLKRKNLEIYYGRDDKAKEIDFLVKHGNKFTKIQVTLELNESNHARELSSFCLASKHDIKGKNLLLSLEDNEEEILYKNIKIEKKNIIKWLLEI